MGTAPESPTLAHSQMWRSLVVLRLPQPLLLCWKKLALLPSMGLSGQWGHPACLCLPHTCPGILCPAAWQTLADPHCWEPPYPGASQCDCVPCPDPPTGGAHALRLTFHSKPATARPPAAPEPASPMKRPEPSLLAKSEAPICRGKKSDHCEPMTSAPPDPEIPPPTWQSKGERRALPLHT